jgi:hypothetical protein
LHHLRSNFAIAQLCDSAAPAREEQATDKDNLLAQALLVHDALIGDALIGDALVDDALVDDALAEPSLAEEAIASEGKTRGTLVQGALCVWTVEREHRNLDIEALTILVTDFGHHSVTASHETRRGVQRNAAGILERFSGLNHRLFADNAGTAHFLSLPGTVGDDPMTALKLDGRVPAVPDLNRIMPDVFVVVGRRRVRHEAC